MNIKFIGGYKTGVGKDLRFPELGEWYPDECKEVSKEQGEALIAANPDFVKWKSVKPAIVPVIE